MVEGWKEVKLGDICDFQKGFAFKSIDYKLFGRKIVRVSNLTNDNVDPSECICIDESKAHEYSQYLLQKDDVIIATVGSWPANPNSVVGKVVKVQKDIENSLLNQNAVRLRGRCLDQKYLFYTLKNKVFFDYIIGTAQGAANQASITQNDIKNYKFILPDHLEQKSIAAILSCLDDKIDLSNRINKNLEEMAQAVFKSWFVDFEPFKDGEFEESELGMIPVGWEVGKAEDYFEISIGKTPPRKESQWFTSCEDDMKWVSIADMGKCGVFIFNTLEYLTKDALEKHNVKVIPENTVILSFKLTVGRLAITTQEMASNEAIAHFRTDKTNINEYLYYYLKLFNYDSLGSTSSIANAVNSKIIKAMPILMPPEAILNEYSKLVLPIFNEIKENQAENQQMTSIRDFLLPKLMSGEIRVPIETE